MFMIEGEWSGYGVNAASAGQRRIVHRHYTTDQFIAGKCRSATIYYTDGTTLQLSVKPVDAKHQPEKPSYTSLIEKCCYQDIWNVADLK